MLYSVFSDFMGQKVHPLGFRLGVSQEHTSHWFAKSRQYSQLVIEDRFLREAISQRFPNVGIGSIEIERQLDTIKIHISSALPRPLLGGFNKDAETYTGLESLRDQLTAQLFAYRARNSYQDRGAQHKRAKADKNAKPIAPKGQGARDVKRDSPQHVERPQISIHVSKLADPDSSAACLAEFVVEQLEKRIPFRRALKQAVQRAQKGAVRGIKVQISGRLNGAEIARSERIHKGQVPLHTLRAKMDYTSRTARTIYGLLGVKVWVFKGAG